MVDDPKKLPAIFYRSLSGAEPVREWLRELGQEKRRVVGYDIGKAEFDWPPGMPLCRKTPRPDLELARARQRETER